MKIAVISDTHNNLATAKKIVDWLNKQKIKTLLHCGDISSRETLDEIKTTFNGEAMFVRGNADVDMENIPEVGEFQIAGKKIAFTHFPEIALNLAGTGDYNAVFYGHTHKPWEEKINNCRLINPGEAAGQINKPTFAVYDIENDKPELKIVERLEK